ncbi:MAG: class II aldolase/adducin family protein [Candidatus Muiribacteriota bacterium]
MNFNYVDEFLQIGHELFLSGLNNFHSGNMSIRYGDLIYITASGSKLGFLKKNDIVMVSLKKQVSSRASIELPIHRAVYENSDYKAIVHAHAPYSVACSLYNRNNIKLVDGEGQFYFPEGIQVLEAANTVGSEEVAEKIKTMSNNNKVIIVKGHGLFAFGQTLTEAAKWISAVEHSMKILHIYGARKD